MVPSAVRPLAVARGGHFRHSRGPGQEESGGEVSRSRHRSRRGVVAPERAKLYDALSAKALRCVVGPQDRNSSSERIAERTCLATMSGLRRLNVGASIEPPRMRSGSSKK